MDPRQAEAFFDEHEDTIRGPVVFMGSPQEDADRGAVHQTYRNHLRSLGLVRATYKKSKKGIRPTHHGGVCLDDRSGVLRLSLRSSG